MATLSTVIVAPMTTKGFDYPFRVSCRFQGKDGLVLLDQIRAVDKSRLAKHLGALNKFYTNRIMFTPSRNVYVLKKLTIHSTGLYCNFTKPQMV